MRGPQIKYVMLVLCAVFLGMAALVYYLVRRYQLPSPILLFSGASAAVGVMLPGLWFYRQRNRLDGTVLGLIGAAQQISRGEFRQALVSTRRDKLGELELAFENMRQALRTTTFTRNYLHSVLNSMTDAVFVTTPEGIVRIANEAAYGLTGFDESELIGKHVVSLLEPSDKAEGDPLQVACEAGETVLRTHSGQTIPVSFVGSTIATDDPQFEGEIYVARDITERKRAERRIRYLARYDALTKIPNRMQFQHLLQQAIARSRRGGHGVAMLYVDMDRFKEVNDTFGHASGDRVLEVLTERLTRVLNSEAVLGRLAGDEFALFVDGISQEADEARSRSWRARYCKRPAKRSISASRRCS
jgi:PAS domain S-box-containing protein